MVRRTANGSREEMADALLKNLVRWQTDRVEEPFGFQKLINARCGEGGVPSEISAQVAFGEAYFV